MLEEELSMLREGTLFKEGSLPLGEDLAEEELQILEGSLTPQCTFFNICWTWWGLRFYAWKIKCYETCSRKRKQLLREIKKLKNCIYSA